MSGSEPIPVPLTHIFWLFQHADEYEKRHKAEVQVTFKVSMDVRLEVFHGRSGKRRVEWFPDPLKAMGWIMAGLGTTEAAELKRLGD